MTETIAVLVVLWVASGVASHIYWVRAKYDYTTSDISTTIFSALVGPLAWVAGWATYGEATVKREPKVLFKKRSI